MYLPKELHTIAECRSRKSCLLQISFRAVFLRVYVKRLCNYPSQYNILYNVATIGRHYTHRNLRSQTIRALIYARHQNHAPQSGAIVFLLLTIFFISLFFLFSITMRPDRPFDRDIALESAGIILTYIFPDSAGRATQRGSADRWPRQGDIR